MTERANRKVVFICGAGHSGSTLLGLILGSHSDCFYAGEAGKTRKFGDANTPLRKRSCKLCGEACPIWSGVEPSAPGELYEQLSTLGGAPVIIDSTKNTDWLETQLAALAAGPSRPYLLFLQRDGRAVFNSRLRKYPGHEPAALIAQWLTQIVATRAPFERFAGHKLELRYEALATEPLQATRRLCAFLGLDYQPAMLAYYQHEHHPLGGNNGTQFLVAQAHAIEGAHVQLSAANRAYYGAHPPGIRLDLRWREELAPRHRRLFEQMAGAINAPYRWGE